MKKITLGLILIFQMSYAQDINLKWSEKISTRSSVTVLGGKNGIYYTTHSNNDNELIGRAYDSELNLKNEKVINFKLDSKKYFYGGAYFLDDQILHFIKDAKRKENKQFLYAGFSDFNLVTSDKINVLDEAEDSKKLSNFGTRSISPDSTKVLIYHEMRFKKSEPTILNYKVYDSKLTEVVNEGSVSLPIKSKSYHTEEVRVDNIGNVYVLAKITKDKNERQIDHSKYYHKLIVFAKDDSVKEFDFDYPNNKISHFDIIPGKNNIFFCTGFLSDITGTAKDALFSDQMFFATLDCNTLSLDASTMLKVPGLYPDKVNNQDFIPYKIRKIYQKKDGGFSIVAEQYQLLTYQSCNDSGCSTRYLYYYCDIACVQTDKNLEVLSVSRIPKFQKNVHNPSIISTFKDDITYVLYDDLTKNLDVADSDKKMKGNSISPSKKSLFLLTINPNGEFKKEQIYSYKDIDIIPRLLSSKEVKPGEILLNAHDQIGVLKVGK